MKTTAPRRDRSVFLELLVTGLSLVATASGWVGPSAPSASVARSSIVSVDGGTHVRRCPNLRCSSEGWVSNGTAVVVVCWILGQRLEPPQSDYASAVWLKVSSRVGVGFVHATAVDQQGLTGLCPGEFGAGAG